MGSSPAVTFAYDGDSLLTSAGNFVMTRSPTTGFVTSATLGQVQESYSYNDFGEPLTTSANAGTTNLYSVTYGARDGFGRITSKTEQVGADPSHAFGYAYDAAGHLRDVTKDGAPLSHYEYDANGNRLVAPGLWS